MRSVERDLIKLSAELALIRDKRTPRRVELEQRPAYQSGHAVRQGIDVRAVVALCRRRDAASTAASLNPNSSGHVMNWLVTSRQRLLTLGEAHHIGAAIPCAAAAEIQQDVVDVVYDSLLAGRRGWTISHRTKRSRAPLSSIPLGLVQADSVFYIIAHRRVRRRSSPGPAPA